MLKRDHRLLVCMAAVTLLASATITFAQNSAPNPYQTVEGVWAALPDGRNWGSTSAVEVSPDGQTIWAIDRCGENTYVGHDDLDIVFQFDLDGNILKQFGAGMFVWPHGIDVDDDGNVCITEDMLPDITGATTRRFDRGGDYFYDQISALHKSIRGTDPDASLYWLVRMLEAGCDPRYIARRLIRVASEDVGNADPRALTLALNSAEAYERLGTPEGELALAQAVVYLACAPKSNAVYKGFNAASADITEFGTLDVPVHLRNAPTKLAQQLEHGKGYRYAHDEPDQYSQGQTYLPEELLGRTYYEPVDSGLEIRIREKLARLKGKLGAGAT